MFAKHALEIVPSEPRTSELRFPFSSRDREIILAELDRLLDSQYFNASRRCSGFLSLIVAEMLKGNVEDLRERALGTTLFNREPGYDTNADPVVRVTAGEVRKRLSQHYQKSGTLAIRIILPVGSYVPRFEIMRNTPATSASARNDGSDRTGGAATTAVDRKPLEPVRVTEMRPLRARHDLRRWPYPAIAIGLIAILFLVVWREHVVAKSIPKALPASAFTTFWKPFLTSQTETVAVFAEMPRHLSPDGLGAIWPQNGAPVEGDASPGISGVGEVMGMHALDEDFKSLHLIMHAKRGSFFTFDDVDGENLIFLGSPLTNQPLQELPTTDFVFRVVKSGSGKSALAIVNNRPLPGEALQFLSTPATLPIESDYAIIALMPGLSPANHILLLAGVTTFGTEAAADFVSREESLKALLPYLRISKTGEIQPFEALIKVTIKNEAPLHEQIVTVHPG